LDSPTRNGMRLDCDNKCLLHHNGIMYPCQMINISISGALICAMDFPPATIQLGDTCDLFLNTNPTSCPGKYSSRVTRLEPSKIALHFLSIAF
jgi:PilZ domain-containing protein